MVANYYRMLELSWNFWSSDKQLRLDLRINCVKEVSTKKKSWQIKRWIIRGSGGPLTLNNWYKWWLRNFKNKPTFTTCRVYLTDSSEDIKLVNFQLGLSLNNKKGMNFHFYKRHYKISMLFFFIYFFQITVNYSLILAA